MKRNTTSTRTALALVGMAGALALGCTHEYQLNGFDATTARLQRSQNKRVAVLLMPNAVRDRYETSTDGHTFIFDKAADYYTRAFRTALQPAVAGVEVFRGNANAPFDAYVYPELVLEASGMLSHTCTARFSVAVVDRNGRLVHKAENAAQETFVPIVNAGQACSTAVAAAFNSTAYQALAALDSW